MKQIYTIPPDVRFIDALAEGLWQKAGSDPLKLSDMLVLLPTRRACRHLREAFLRLMNAKATLLPRLQPLGDIDDEEFYFIGHDNLDIPPAITPIRRQLLLTQLIKKKDDDLPIDQAAQLAMALGKFLDQAQIERCDFANLQQLVPHNFALHWQQSLQFLEILTMAWPPMVAAEGCLDPAVRRNRLLEAQAKLWSATPPSYPVIAAGSTGSMPATADLLKVIASMPGGTVILPGLDQGLAEEAWQAIEETHPQFGMKKLLEEIGTKRGDVKAWYVTQPPQPRVRLLHESMRPADVTDAWRHLRTQDFPPALLSGLTRLELDHPQEEAQVIALLMRRALEVPGKTAMLVTGDRSLAERVVAMLARWNIAVNDSAGTSLTTHPIGGFLLDVLAASSPKATPVDDLSLLKHPLAACGFDPAECRARARQAELFLMRLPMGGRRDKIEIQEIKSWFDQFKSALNQLTENWRRSLPLAAWVRNHIALTEQLATSDQEKGADRLWKSEAGEAMAEWLNDWQSAAHDFPLLNGDEYERLFTSLLRAVTVRPAYGQHPRLSILGPLEARLIQADLTILGGLNEGSWPPETEIDPWMSRPMKRDFGLPLPERRVGLSAHDFVHLASAPEVVLTRSKRAGNAPTTPSRFLLQFETVLRALGYHSRDHDALAPSEPWQLWAQALDEAPNPKPCDPPAPCPPIEWRPHQLSVTEVGLWRRNPYAIYARHVLDLRKLEPIEMDVTAADRGLITHKALEEFLKAFPDELPLNAIDELLKIGRKIFDAYKDWPQVDAFWWPRFERMARWFVESVRERQSEGIKVLEIEASGQMTFGGFTLRGRADRIDQLPDGTIAIIDYKTGELPRQWEVREGYEPQLLLLALMASEGGFKNIRAAPSEIAYWKMTGGAEAGKEQPITKDIQHLSNVAREGLKELIAAFADPATPYQVMPKPYLKPRYDDYMHLARVAEWGVMGEEG